MPFPKPPNVIPMANYSEKADLRSYHDSIFIGAQPELKAIWMQKEFALCYCFFLISQAPDGRPMPPDMKKAIKTYKKDVTTPVKEHLPNQKEMA
jgi:hypothetical protein